MGKESICVTGAGGFIASWVVNLLLEKGYSVHGTVRNPEKNSHLKGLKNAGENLRLFKADLLDYDSLEAAISGCSGVLHVASPVLPAAKITNPEVDMIEPALVGTQNVLNACLKNNVKKVVVVSSVGAVAYNTLPKDKPMDESCWSNIELCKAIQEWYCVSKTLAETEVWKYAEKTDLKITTICPAVVIGPMLQPTINASSKYLLNYLTGAGPIENALRPFVDVRDVAEAILLLYENSQAEGRYICSSHDINSQKLVEMMKKMFPYHNFQTRYKEESRDLMLSSEKLRKFGWQHRPFEETIADTIRNYEESGLLPSIPN